MSNEIFYWQPHMLDCEKKTKFDVAHTLFENGMEQRSLSSQKETNTFSFVYKQKLLNPGETTKLKNEISAFFNARSGSYDNFFLPSWQLECKTMEAVTTADNTFKINKDPSYLGFSDTVGEYGNYIYVCKGFARSFELSDRTHEIRRILSWVADGDNYVVTVDSTFDNNHAAKTYIQKATKVFFATPELPETFNIPYVVEIALGFKEDIASLYQSDFGA